MLPVMRYAEKKTAFDKGKGRKTESVISVKEVCKLFLLLWVQFLTMSWTYVTSYITTLSLYAIHYA